MRSWFNKIIVQLADNSISMIRRNALNAANQFMEEVQGVTRIGCSRIDTSLGGVCRDILAFEQFAVLIASRS